MADLFNGTKAIIDLNKDNKVITAKKTLKHQKSTLHPPPRFLTIHTGCTLVTTHLQIFISMEYCICSQMAL
jgi:hypothetical protein